MPASARAPFRIGVVVDEFFCSEYPPLGGFGLTAKNLAEFFHARPHLNIEVVALLPPFRGAGPAPTELHQTPVLQVPIVPSKLGAARSILMQAKIDLLIAIDYYPTYFTRLMAAPRLPVILWLRDPHSPDNWDQIMSLANSEFASQYNENARERFRFYRELYLSRRLLGRTFVSAVQEPWLLPRARAACSLIDEDCHRMVNRITIPATLPAKAERPTMLFIGRLVPVKRPWIYFEIAKRLPDYDFLVIGEMDRHGRLQDVVAAAEATPNLHFLGSRVGADLHRVIGQSWLMVNTSIHEGMPQSILDCLAFGVPVVSALDYGGTIETFGVSVGAPQGDGRNEIEPFCREIERLVSDDAARQRLGATARRFVQEKYSEQAFFRQFVALLERSRIRTPALRALFETGGELTPPASREQARVLQAS
ncbi:MAG: glycosyltransferase [Alphaproteobacteria bacterium]|jgi:glycosyltransferase involved in cell wall biosynthesis|nr:glycosyltransferase [Alphaproteobacteria bacterium]